MPRYYFDIADGGPHSDDTGTECVDDEDVRRPAMRALPGIANEHIPANGDRGIYTVVARDEFGRSVYAATLSFVGLWLNR
jgi:hypothetical protein